MATIDELARAVLDGEPLRARALANEIVRTGHLISGMPPPDPRCGERALIMAAALAELLAGYAEVPPPAWARGNRAMPETVDLLPAKSEPLRSILAADSPEPLKRRNILAPAGYLRAV